MEIRKCVISGKSQFGKYTKSVPEAAQPSFSLRTETEINIRRSACLPKAEATGVMAVKNETYKVHSEPVESTVNMGPNQGSSQSQKTSFSGTKSKYTSSVSIIPRTNGLPKSLTSDGAKSIRQVRKSNSVGTYLVGTNNQKQLPKVKSFESPKKTKASSKCFRTYVSCVQTSLSNSWKFQQRNKSIEESKNDRFKSKSAADQTQKALPVRIYSAISDSKSNEVKKVTVENSAMTKMPRADFISNGTSKDKYRGSLATTEQHFVENLQSQHEESYRKTNRMISTSQVRIQETPRAKRVNFNCSRNNVVYCRRCSLSINPTSEKKTSTENEHEKNSDKNFHGNSSSECLLKRTLVDAVRIQALSIPIRSLTFSTPGKNSDGNFSRAKGSLASISVQEKNNWRSMSFSSEVPIIIISSVDE